VVGRKVIVVEDDSALAGVIAATLRAVGCNVLGVAASGEDALDLAERSAPDVIVMDVGLAGRIDGIEAARRLRRRCGCPVIFHTAFADPEHTAEMQSIRRSAILRKPCPMDRLVRAVQTAEELDA